jgi:hypothetical protein
MPSHSTNTKAPSVFNRLESVENQTSWQRMLQSKSFRLGLTVSIAAHLLAGLILAFCVIAEHVGDQFEIAITSLMTEGTAAFEAPLETPIAQPLDLESTNEVNSQFTTEHLAPGGGPGLDSIAESGSGAAGSGTGDGSGEGLDAGIGAEINKAVGGRGGALSKIFRASLVWENRNDVDLRLRFSGGGGNGKSAHDEVVSYGNMHSPSGYQLDVDSNIAPEHNPGVENIVLKKGVPPDGHYVLDMHYFVNHPGEPFLTECKLYFVAGQVERMVYAKFLRENQRVPLLTFDVKQGVVVNLKQAPGTTVAPKSRPKNEIEAERLLAEVRQLMEEVAAAEPFEAEKLRTQIQGLLKRITTEFNKTPAAKEARKLINSGF